MRIAVQLGLVVCLLLAFNHAPFRHSHADGLPHSHGHGLIQSHVHLRLLTPDRVTLQPDSPHSEVRLQQWLGFEGKQRVEVPVAGGQICSLFAPVPVLWEPAPQPAPCNHDPPGLENLAPRAPPA